MYNVETGIFPIKKKMEVEGALDKELGLDYEENDSYDKNGELDGVSYMIFEASHSEVKIIKDIEKRFGAKSI